MDFAVGDLVKALAGPMVGEIGKVVAIGVDGLLHVLHLNGTFAAHYAPDQVAQVPCETIGVAAEAFSQPKVYAAPTEPGMPHSSQARKETPVATGVLAYFPDAIAEEAKVSFIGNDKHNPGEPLRWARGKSTDQPDAAVRHIMDFLAAKARGLPVRDKDGNHFLAQAAWRVHAMLQLDVEAEQAGKGGGK